MKRIAILTNGYPPDASGGSVNVSSIASELIRQGNRVKVFTASGAQYESDDKKMIYRLKYGFFVRKIRRIKDEISSRTRNSRVLYFCEFFDSLLAGRMKKKIKEFSPDILVTVCYPFKNIIIGKQLKDSMPEVKWYPYYLDPFFSSPQYRFSSVPYILKKEKKILKKADRVIMLRWMSDKYIRHKAVDRRKLKTVGLPLMPYECCGHPRSGDSLELVYAGQLYKDIRDPSAAFGCLAKVLNDNCLPHRFTLVGNIHGFSEKEKNRWLSDFNGRLTIVGAVSPDEIGSYYDRADILISVGNSNTELMPSKILQYIGTGKPIIHFYKKYDCPARLILSRYRNALCIYEKDPDGSKVLDFIREKGNAAPIPPEDILREFREYDIRTIINAFH